MKIHLKFDHTKKDCLKAIDCQYSGKEVNKRAEDVIDRYITDDDISKQSHLCELIHNTLDYEEILFLAAYTLQENSEKYIIKKLRGLLE